MRRKSRADLLSFFSDLRLVSELPIDHAHIVQDISLTDITRIHLIASYSVYAVGIFAKYDTLNAPRTDFSHTICAMHAHRSTNDRIRDGDKTWGVFSTASWQHADAKLAAITRCSASERHRLGLEVSFCADKTLNT